MHIAYDDRGDLLYVQFRVANGPAASREYPGDRFVESDQDGVVGIEFLHASEGVDLEGMPDAGAIADVLRSFAALLASAVRLAPA
jgi:uncharacterized protein YuzE